MSENTKDQDNARTFGGVVYVGGVVAATVLFISFVLTAFPEDAYFSRVVMTIAGCAVGMSMLAFPYALHHWVISKSHRAWGVPLYYIELLFIAVNTVTSFISLLAMYTEVEAPKWVALYEPFSVGAIIYTVAAWGTLFLTDPDHKRRADERDADTRFAAAVARKREEFLNSVEGEDLVVAIASADIAARWNIDTYGDGKKHFGTGKKSIPAPAPFVKKEAQTTTPAPLAEQDGQEQ